VTPFPPPASRTPGGRGAAGGGHRTAPASARLPLRSALGSSGCRAGTGADPHPLPRRDPVRECAEYPAPRNRSSAGDIRRWARVPKRARLRGGTRGGTSETRGRKTEFLPQNGDAGICVGFTACHRFSCACAHAARPARPSRACVGYRCGAGRCGVLPALLRAAGCRPGSRGCSRRGRGRAATGCGAGEAAGDPCAGSRAAAELLRGLTWLGGGVVLGCFFRFPSDRRCRRQEELDGGWSPVGADRWARWSRRAFPTSAGCGPAGPSDAGTRGVPLPRRGGAPAEPECGERDRRLLNNNRAGK